MSLGSHAQVSDTMLAEANGDGLPLGDGGNYNVFPSGTRACRLHLQGKKLHRVGIEPTTQ